MAPFLYNMKEYIQNPFDNSRLLDVHRWSYYPEVKKAVQELNNELSFNDRDLPSLLTAFRI